MRSITRCLWFDANAEEAVGFYTSIVPRTVIQETARYGGGAPLPAGTALTVRFKMAGQEFLALNGGPHFTFTESRCGWLKDRYGLSWQVVPASLGRML